MNNKRLFQVILILCFLLMGIGICKAQDYGTRALLQALQNGADQRQQQSQQQFELQRMFLQQQFDLMKIQPGAAATQQGQQTNINSDGKIFSGRVYQDIETAKKEYDAFSQGKALFSGYMFSLNDIPQKSNTIPVFNSLQINQMTTVYQGSDGRYYIVMRIQ